MFIVMGGVVLKEIKNMWGIWREVDSISSKQVNLDKNLIQYDMVKN